MNQERSDDSHFIRSCGRKRRYNNKTKAMYIVATAPKLEGCHVYGPCIYCHGFHIGHLVKKS